ncbi:MAG: DUF354 domain-containing protein [Haloarculaceae archaeon]
MRILVTIQHAGHVHFFKHAIAELRAAGHEVHVFARDNELSTTMLDRCGIEYELLAGPSDSLPSLARAQAVYELRLLRRARELDPDVMTAIGGVAVSHVAGLVGARSVVFYDTEHATIICRLAFPFADTVCTPECYGRDVGANQVRYPGYHELAYLHPDRFDPDPAVLEGLGVDPDDRIAVVRLGDWGSSHDVGASGFEDPRAVVRALADEGATVFVDAEGSHPTGLDARRLDIAPERLHDLLYYADLYVGEGATTAAECAVLGTPAVYVSSLELGYLSELQSRYGLVWNCTGPDRDERAVETARRLVARDDAVWQSRRDRLLAEKVDATRVVLEQLTGADAASERASVAPGPPTRS